MFIVGVVWGQRQPLNGQRRAGNIVVSSEVTCLSLDCGSTSLSLIPSYGIISCCNRSSSSSAIIHLLQPLRKRPLHGPRIHPYYHRYHGYHPIPATCYLLRSSIQKKDTTVSIRPQRADNLGVKNSINERYLSSLLPGDALTRKNVPTALTGDMISKG